MCLFCLSLHDSVPTLLHPISDHFSNPFSFIHPLIPLSAQARHTAGQSGDFKARNGGVDGGDDEDYDDDNDDDSSNFSTCSFNLFLQCNLSTCSFNLLFQFALPTQSLHSCFHSHPVIIYWFILVDLHGSATSTVRNLFISFR